jgi:hypothetical protein
MYLAKCAKTELVFAAQASKLGSTAGLCPFNLDLGFIKEQEMKSMKLSLAASLLIVGGLIFFFT